MKRKIHIVARKGLFPDDFVLKFLHENCEIIEDPSTDTEVDIVSVGGDGTLNEGVRQYSKLNQVHIGFHRGSDKYSEGFMLNPAEELFLQEYARGDFYYEEIPMLKIQLFDKAGNCTGIRYAYGDCYFKENSSGMIHVKLIVNGEVRFNPIDCDGMLVCTAVGSTAYNASAFGAILPLDSKSMVLTSLLAKPQYQWHSSILSAKGIVEMEPLNTERRGANFFFDGQRVDGVARAVINQSRERKVKLAFANSYDFGQKVLNLQFGIRHERRER